MLLLALLPMQGPQGPISLHSGQIITRSARVLRRTYRISGVVIRGDNVTVDFAGATLQGSPTDTAIRVDGGTNVHIINARVRGYKVGILARGTHHLTLQNNDLSYNWKPRLFSLVEHESLVDWLSFLPNKRNEGLPTGPRFYLPDVVAGTTSENAPLKGMTAPRPFAAPAVAFLGTTFP